MVKSGRQRALSIRDRNHIILLASSKVVSCGKIKTELNLSAWKSLILRCLNSVPFIANQKMKRKSHTCISIVLYDWRALYLASFFIIINTLRVNRIKQLKYVTKLDDKMFKNNNVELFFVTVNDFFPFYTTPNFHCSPFQSDVCVLLC